MCDIPHKKRKHNGDGKGCRPPPARVHCSHALLHLVLPSPGPRCQSRPFTVGFHLFGARGTTVRKTRKREE